ncbi:hypothetical protein Tco_1241452 [Tanacetum coccineum]
MPTPNMDGIDVVTTVSSVESDLRDGNYKHPKGSSKSNADMGTNGVDQQHDGMHRPLSFASFLHEESSQRKIESGIKNLNAADAVCNEMTQLLRPTSAGYKTCS